MSDVSNFIEIINDLIADYNMNFPQGVGGGPYTVTLNSPTTGSVTVLDTGSNNSFVLPPSLNAQSLIDADGDTSVDLVESGAAAGGDRMDFIVDNITVGAVERLADGTTKWTLDGILDPIVYAGTALTTAQRNALTLPSPGYLVYNSSLNKYEYYDGSTWIPWGGNSFTFLDEDDLISDSDTAVASQQSIKAYIDNLHTSYSGTFAVTDWTLNSGVYNIVVPQFTHGIPATDFIKVTVHRDNGTGWENVPGIDVVIDKTTGDVELCVTGINSRFAGRILIER